MTGKDDPPEQMPSTPTADVSSPTIPFTPTTPITRVSYAASTSSSSTAADPEAERYASFDKVRNSSDNDSLLAIPTSPPPVDIVEEEQKVPDDAVKDSKKVASWSSLPRKGQLALLTISRLSEPLTQTSLQSYMFYQLKSFDPSLPDSTISAQAGMMQAAFTATQFITAIAWGRAADSERFGRKLVLMIGLMGTMISALGFGFSKSFVTAMFFRSIGGALNGNVGVMRTMISEIIKEKKFQSRAFMVLPMTFNIGVIIGPIMGKLNPRRETGNLLMTQKRWTSLRSSSIVSRNLWPRKLLRRRKRRSMDVKLSIRAPKSCQRHVSRYLGRCCLPWT
jgi:hypothetical protein